MAAVDVIMTLVRDKYDLAKTAIDAARTAINVSQASSDVPEKRFAQNEECHVAEVQTALATLRVVLDKNGAVPT